MRLPFYQVDSFTGTVFRGNPAGVVLLKEWIPERTMQAIAAENNLSETAFVHPRGNAFELRWFTPEIEVDLCGHATLASAYVIFEEGLSHGDAVQFSTKADVLTVRRDGAVLSMDFPARPGEPEPVTDQVTEALGAKPGELLRSRDIMAVFGSEGEVAALEPRFDILKDIDALGVIATAPGLKVDFVSRFFAPMIGIPEDPVTGSAHCTLIPYWSRRLGKKKLLARQLSRRGGEIRCEDLGERVKIGGEAVLYLRGEIEVPRT
jgi:PhzF family phenazine biosynthesis protein